MDALDLLDTVAPEFATVDAPRKDDAIAVADMQIAPKLCGDRRPLLVAYLAAHVLALASRQGGAAGSVTSLSEGKLSASFGASGVDGSLGQTSYGVEYDRLAQSCTFAPRTRVRL